MSHHKLVARFSLLFSMLYKDQLNKALNSSGWQVSEILSEEAWFAQEHWRIQSKKECYGLSIILSFMNTWDIDGLTPYTSEVCAFASHPTEDSYKRIPAIASWCLSENRPSGLINFLETLNGYRIDIELNSPMERSK